MKRFLLIICLFLVACQGGVKKTSSSRPVISKEFLKAQNSYYHLVTSLIQRQQGNAEVADSLLELALKKDKDSGYLWSQKALLEAKRLKWSQALVDAQQSLENDPDNVDSLILMGKLYAAKNQAEKAIPYYKQVIELDKTNEEAYAVMAREYISLNETSNATQTLKKCLKYNPESMNCMYYLATILQKYEKYDQAADYFNIINQLNPGNIKILQALGDIYLKQKEYQKALAIYLQLKTLSPKDVNSQIKTALIYYEIKQVDLAIAEFLSVRKNFPNSDKLNYFLGLLYMQQKDFEQAVFYLEKVQESSSYYKDAFTKRILILKKQQKFADAIRLIDSKSNKQPAELLYYDLKISLQILQKDYVKALAIVEEGLTYYKDHKGLLFRKAVILDKMNRWNQAEEELIRMIQLYPNFDRALNYLGYSYVDKGINLPQAYAYLSTAYKLKPKDPYIADSLAWYYHKTGKSTKALGLLQKAYKEVPDEPIVLEHLGEVYFSLKNKRQARIYLEKALQILRSKQQRSQLEEEQLSRVQQRLGEF